MKIPSVSRPELGLRYVKGIGPKRAESLEKVGVRSLHDLLLYFPRRYEDRSTFKKIAHLSPGDMVTVKGRVLSAVMKRLRRTVLVEIVIGDETGMLPAVWFNQPYLKNQFLPDREIILYGKADYHQGRFQLNSPEYEILDSRDASIHTGRITPIYPLTNGLYQKSMRSVLYDVTHNRREAMLDDFLPDDFRQRLGLSERCSALREIHFPASSESLESARRRLVFDEFLLFEVTLLQKIRLMKTRFRSHGLEKAEAFLSEFSQSLPFVLTEGQRSAMKEIASDICKQIPMNRLVMGDVGSGKTAAAAYALGAAARSGLQGALLVPTEVLANQHYETLMRLYQPFGISLRLLTSSTERKLREKILGEFKEGRTSCLVGTHALLQEDVEFKALGLVVIDEQHKFGVHQRCKLLDRPIRPHQLVMTATPIPRTLALTVYGDLDISTIRGLPSGRRPVKTYWIARAKQARVYEHMAEKLRSGEQAYLIFPLVEETEKVDLLAAVQEFEKLRKGMFKDFKVGLVHGKMPGPERDAVMKSFKAQEIQVLVATTVIEVGVDNPNATMLVIENAERFGLSQLHQMRGRIGRGSKDSECFLFGEPQTEEGKKRLRIMTRTQDGFEIAEEDLKLRGPGDFWGTRQSGEPLFRLADPARDQPLLTEARGAARRIVDSGQLKTGGEWESLKNYLDQFPIRY